MVATQNSYLAALQQRVADWRAQHAERFAPLEAAAPHVMEAAAPPPPPAAPAAPEWMSYLLPVPAGQAPLAFYDSLIEKTGSVPRSQVGLLYAQAVAGWRSLGIDTATSDQFIADYVERERAKGNSLVVNPDAYGLFHAGTGGSGQVRGSPAQMGAYATFHQQYPGVSRQNGLSPALVHDISLGISMIPVVGSVASTAINVAEATLGAPQTPGPRGPAPSVQVEGLFGQVELGTAPAAPAGSGISGLVLLALVALVMD